MTIMNGKTIHTVFLPYFSSILSFEGLMAELSQKVFWRFPSFPTSCECSITMATIIYSVNSSGDQYPLLAPSVLGLEFHQEFTDTLLRNQKHLSWPLLFWLSSSFFSLFTFKGLKTKVIQRQLFQACSKWCVLQSTENDMMLPK